MWEYSPREIFGFLKLANERQLQEAAEQLMLQSMAARGEWKDVDKLIQKLAREQP